MSLLIKYKDILIKCNSVRFIRSSYNYRVHGAFNVSWDFLEYAHYCLKNLCIDINKTGASTIITKNDFIIYNERHQLVFLHIHCWNSS